ncbi:MAG TPA: outer membrane protein assembly factor BamA [Vicinamibacterales bacterium]|nr:outer membrane protein assembly factor BamA [Vicinamibacterales bacterium]
MKFKFLGVVGAALLALGLWTGPAQAAQTPGQPAVNSAQPAVTQTLRQPPAGSGPLVRFIELRFEPVNESLIEPQTYLYYIQTQPSRSADGVWVPFTEETERLLLDDFKRLWATSFLDNLRIEVLDAPYDNGVLGKRIIFHMEERPRVKIVEYNPSDKVDRTKIDEKMKEAGVALRLDSFLDQSTVRRVEGILRNLMAEKGHQFAEVKSRVEELPGGPKLAKVIFDITEGPKVKVRDIEFVGNEEVSDGSLKRRMKETKEHWFLSFITGRGTYQETKFEEDAEKVEEYYREKGYIQARVGAPEIKTMEDSADKETRWVQLRVPVTEGPRYKVGQVTFEGNTVVKTEFLQPLFKLKPGEYYSEKSVRKGFEKAREIYGGGGYFEFTGFPDMKFEEPAEGPVAGPAEPTVNVTMRLTEGEQYFVNRITFTGNNTTRDNVIRRELRLVEGGVFSTEALKYSIRRLNQLGYFQNLEQSPNAVDVQKTVNSKNEVDVTLKLEEQNRNQLTFGAGVSQFEGFFGQLSFQTSNFLGRGESLTLSLQAGSRAENYQLAFTEPFLFDRNITGGVDIYKRKLQYINQFTQESTGGNMLMGFPVADFSRLFVTYSYEGTQVSGLNEAFFDSSCFFREGGCREISLDDPSQLTPDLLNVLRSNPFLVDSLLIGQRGKRTISKLAPSYVFNTIDNPIFPSTGRRLSLSADFAGLGGNTNFVKPRAEAVGFFRHTTRTSFGFRGQFEYIRPYGSTTILPIFERLFLGGEYSIRGFDIRSIGPRDTNTQLVLGGNKSLLVNAEYLITIAGPVRLVLFADAGQVRNIGQSFTWKEDVLRFVPPPSPVLFDPLATTRITVPGAPEATTEVTGQTHAFKMSTGAEIRFFMPVLNVPFRLIFAHNPSRLGVLDNNFQPAKRFTFRFAVGTTF